MDIPRIKIRGFEVCRGWEDKEVRLPEQATAGSAGYDFYAVEDVEILPVYIQGQYYRPPTLVPTGVKAYMRRGEVLQLYARSSLAKRGMHLANSVGIVDHDYFGCAENDGHIMFMYQNLTDKAIKITKGERIGQGIFMQHFFSDQPISTKTRNGGFGSSGS